MEGDLIMMLEYIQSEEMYKGYKLVIRMTCLGDNLQYHRSCEAWKDGERISVGKTKKEMKELIDGGYLEMVV